MTSTVNTDEQALAHLILKPGKDWQEIFSNPCLTPELLKLASLVYLDNARNDQSLERRILELILAHPNLSDARTRMELAKRFPISFLKRSDVTDPEKSLLLEFLVNTGELWFAHDLLADPDTNIGLIEQISSMKKSSAELKAKAKLTLIARGVKYVSIPGARKA